MNLNVKCFVAPPLVASDYTCGSSVVAPVFILWLAGCVSVGFGLIGGPTGQPTISWNTIGFGMLLVLTAGIWTWFVIRSRENCKPIQRS